MAKLAFFLSMILAISFTCSATVDSPQSQARFEDSMNTTLMTFQNLIDEIVGEQSSPDSPSEEDATAIIPREVLFSTPEKIGVQISLMASGSATVQL